SIIGYGHLCRGILDGVIGRILGRIIGRILGRIIGWIVRGVSGWIVSRVLGRLFRSWFDGEGEFYLGFAPVRVTDPQRDGVRALVGRGSGNGPGVVFEAESVGEGPVDDRPGEGA